MLAIKENSQHNAVAELYLMFPVLIQILFVVPTSVPLCSPHRKPKGVDRVCTVLYGTQDSTLSVCSYLLHTKSFREGLYLLTCL